VPRSTDNDYRTIFEAASDGLIVTDPETGLVVAANAAFCRMHACVAADVIGGPPSRFVEPVERLQQDSYFAAVLAGEEVRVRTRGLRRDGTTFPADLRATLLEFAGRPHVLAVVRDVTEIEAAHAELEERVAERTHELTVLLDVARSVSSSLDLDEVFTVVLDGLARLVPSDTAVVSILEPDGLHFVSAAVRQSPASLRERVERGLRYRVADLSFWPIVERGEPFIANDTQDDSPEGRMWRESRNARGLPKPSYVRGYMAVPMRLHDRTIGGITVTQPLPNAFTRRHAALVGAVASHAAVAVENARLFQRAAEAAALEERQRLARELHDSVSQLLFAINLNAGAARTGLDRDPVRAVKPLDEVVRLARAASAETRALVLALRPETLEQEGLVGAVSRQIEALQARGGLVVETQLPPEPDAPLPLKEAIYRIAQEALHNVAKHAEARNVIVRIAQEEGALVLEVADDGAGFDPSVARPGHVGQRSMRERAANAGGVLSVDSAPGCGTRLRAVIPTHAPM
jgi:PAS domain S-box-containing protein